jgi:hypothetical protein
MSISVELVGLDDLIAEFGMVTAALRQAGIRLHADAPYAGFVEHGTRRMAARPYLAPAEERTVGTIAALVAEGIVETLQTGDEGAMRRNLARGAQLVEEEAQSIVHVVTGYLRSTIHAEVL